MPLALAGSLIAVQFCYPAELPLTLDKIEHFETGSLEINLSVFLLKGLHKIDKGFDCRYGCGVVN